MQLLVVSKLALEDIAIGTVPDTESVMFVVAPLAFVSLFIGPLRHTHAISVGVNPLAFVLASTGEAINAGPLPHTVVELADVLVAIVKKLLRQQVFLAMSIHIAIDSVIPVRFAMILEEPRHVDEAARCESMKREFKQGCEIAKPEKGVIGGTKSSSIKILTDYVINLMLRI